MNWEYKREICERLRYKQHLTPIFGSTHDIPERVYEYSPSLFVVFNNESGRFEIHSLHQDFDTFACELPYKTLDARALRYIWNNDIRVHGRAIMERIEKSEQKHKERKEREFKDWVRGTAEETKSMFAKDAWTMAT